MIMNEGDIVPSLELSQQKLLAGIGRWISKGSAWIIDRIEGHYANVHKCNPLERNSCMTLPRELQHMIRASLIFKIRMINVIRGAMPDIRIQQMSIRNGLLGWKEKQRKTCLITRVYAFQLV